MSDRRNHSIFSVILSFVLPLITISTVVAHDRDAKFTVFEKNYVRATGKPKAVTDTFSVLNPETRWIVKVSVDDDDDDKDYRRGRWFHRHRRHFEETDFVILLNGKQILKFQRCRDNDRAIEQQLVNLKATNTLSVEVRGEPGDEVKVKIIGVDHSEPTVGWLAPQANQTLTTATVSASVQFKEDISGLDPASLQISLDNTSVLSQFTSLTNPTLNATLSANLSIPNGSHTLKAKIKNMAGEVESQSVTFTVVIDPNLQDKDSDGFTPAVGDCNDQNANIYPTAFDIPNNGIDENCDEVDAGIVPNLVGLTRSAAEAAILAAHLVVGSVTTDNSDTVPAGQIISQSPIAAETVPQGTVVGFMLSLGPVLDLPPDPSTVAPPMSETGLTNFFEATSFLYTGSDPIQTGVQPDAIDPVRTAVLRGKVLDRSGSPIYGVTVSILNHPELGKTLTRLDGMFDLVVNGGGDLVVTYKKEGFLSSSRQMDTPWQDYVILPDVVLIPADIKVTSVDLTSFDDFQVAQGSVSSDEDGDRQGTLLIPQGTQATMIIPGQGSVPLNNLNIRITEFTVGDSGPAAMPAELPATSAYTYAFDVNADEAVAAGATEIKFNKPLVYYVDNFLDFPAGIGAPLGFYDESKGQWIPHDNGRVIKILSVVNNIAQLDIAGTDQPATDSALSALGITLAERQKLASLYSAGKSLWRVKLPHFSSWDINMGSAPPDNATVAFIRFIFAYIKSLLSSDCKVGSIIECQPQVLGESVDIPGTPFNLNYRSNRVVGYKSTNTIQLNLSENPLPPSVKRIVLNTTIAGQRFHQEFPAQNNLIVPFTWDGKDVYGRKLFQPQTAFFDVGYVYDAVYQTTSRFGYNGNGIIISAESSGAGVAQRQEVTLWNNAKTTMGVWDARKQDLGGWTLNVRHTYDPLSNVFYGGDGSQRQILGDPDTKNVLVSQVYTSSNAPLSSLDVGPDGSVYVLANELVGTVVRRIYPNGTSQIVAGGGNPVNGIGNDGPATLAKLTLVFGKGGVAVAPDGTLYIGENTNAGGTQSRIRRVTPDGMISTYAGGGSPADGLGDGKLATEAALTLIDGLALGKDGTLYIAERFSLINLSWHARVRKIDPDGIISTLVSSVDPSDVVAAPDGSVYFSDLFAPHSIWRVWPSGRLERLAARVCQPAETDCYQFNNSQNVFNLTLGSDQSVYFAASGETAWSNFIYHLKDNSLTKVAGSDIPFNSVHVGLANQIGMKPGDLAFSPNGSLYFLNPDSQGVQKLTTPLPGFQAGNIPITSEDGSEIYLFDTAGRHVRTISTLTGIFLYQFGYDAQGLKTITDKNGNITTIERNSAGKPTAIVGSFGQRTTLEVDTNGYLSKVIQPNGDTYQLVTSSDGLLTKFIHPNNNASTFSYDALGLLKRDENALGGAFKLDRQNFSNGYEISLKDALNRTTLYRSEFLENGEEHRLNTLPDGTQNSQVIRQDYSVSSVSSDGTTMELVRSADSRFGLQSPLIKNQTVRTSGGLTSVLSTSRSTVLSNPNDILSVVGQSETVNINGKIHQSFYDAATRTRSVNTSGGRRMFSTFDNSDRLVKYEVPTFLPVNYSYDTRGRLIRSSQGTGGEERILTLTYHPQGYLKDVTNSLNEKVSYEYDLKGRVLKQTLPDGRFVEYTYDGNDNLLSITPPGRPKHQFVYTEVDLAKNYTPPTVTGGGQTTYLYNLAKQLTSITRPDGQVLTYNYDTAGRLSMLATPDGTTTYVYHPTTGNLSSITAPDNGILRYTYDGSLPLSEEWDGVIRGRVSQTYNNDFRIVSQSVNGASTANFTYDNDGLLTSAGSLNITRHGFLGTVSGTVLGNFRTDLGYNNFAELSSDVARYSGTLYLQHFYGYDKVGRINTRSETDQTKTDNYSYTYDTAGRLTDVRKNSLVVSHYDYDTNGNRLSATIAGVVETGTYDDQDRLLTYGNASYAYTANGELKSKTAAGLTTLYSYDVLGNLRQVTLPDGKTIDYLIDANDRRIGKKVNGVLVQGFLYEDDLSPVAELDGSNNVVSRFVYGTRINVPDYFLKGGKTYRIVTDHLGSVRMVVDTSNGTIVQRIDYDEFGRILNDTNPGFQPFGFAGGLYEKETGLVRFGARDYDAYTGRWSAKDPIGFDGGDTNLFGYVLGDPVNLIDPKGLYAAWLVQLLKNGGTKVIKTITSKAEAVFLKKKGKDIVFSSKQAAKDAMRAATGGNKNILKHKGHDLPNGKNGRPHFQSDDFSGHAFWSSVGVFMVNLLDPFGADALADEDEDLDGNGVPDWMDEYNDNCP